LSFSEYLIARNIEISKTLKQEGQSTQNTTVERYLEYLVASFIFYKLNRCDIKGKKQLATQEK
jgi:predicted AAA+ superfamily ATPase